MHYLDHCPHFLFEANHLKALLNQKLKKKNSLKWKGTLFNCLVVLALEGQCKLKLTISQFK